MSSRREILVTFTNLTKKRLHQPDSFWLWLSCSTNNPYLDSLLDFWNREKNLTEVSDASEIVRTDIY